MGPVAAPSAGALLGQSGERDPLVSAPQGLWQRDDHKSQRIEAYADFIIAEVAATPDITLEKLRTKLIDAHEARFGLTTIWRFFDRRSVTYRTYGPSRWQAVYAR